MVSICKGDITLQSTDAIVNASNTLLLPGAGVCGAIYARAGFADLVRETRKIPVPLKVGQAVHTSGLALKAKYIIHTAGPVYVDGNHGEEELLASCYRNAVDLAKELGLKSITFPLISAGIFGYPKEKVIRVALKSLVEKVPEKDFDAILILYSDEDYKMALEITRTEFDGKVSIA